MLVPKVGFLTEKKPGGLPKDPRITFINIYSYFFNIFYCLALADPFPKTNLGPGRALGPKNRGPGSGPWAPAIFGPQGPARAQNFKAWPGLGPGPNWSWGVGQGQAIKYIMYYILYIHPKIHPKFIGISSTNNPKFTGISSKNIPNSSELHPKFIGIS